MMIKYGHNENCSKSSLLTIDKIMTLLRNVTKSKTQNVWGSVKTGQKIIEDQNQKWKFWCFADHATQYSLSN